MKFRTTMLMLAISIIFSMGLGSSAISDSSHMYWNFDENTGTLAADSTSFSRNLTTILSTAWIPGKINSAVQLNGSGKIETTFNTSGFVSATYNFWLQKTDSSNANVAFAMIDVTSNPNDNGEYRFAGGTGLGFASNRFGIDIMDNSVRNITEIPFDFDVGVWNMVTITLETNLARFYINSEQKLNITLDAFTLSPVGKNITMFGDTSVANSLNRSAIDEFGIFNKTLSQAEISVLYNSGAGNTFPFVSTIEVVLDSPVNGSAITETNVTFNATLTPFASDLTNATLNIWFANGTLVNETTNIITGNVSNTTGWIVSNLSVNDYLWNVFGCQTDVCGWGLNNLSFSIRQLTITGQTFNNDVFETDSQAFRIDMDTTDSSLSVDAKLVYNGTIFQGTTVCNLGSCNSTVIIDIPLVGSGPGNQNKSFFWNLTVFEGSSSSNVVSDINQQNVTEIQFGVCSAALSTIALNFTAFDEQTSSRIDPFYMAGEFDFWLGNGTTRRELSFSNTTVSELDLCISPTDRNMFIEDTIEYNQVINSTIYNTRNYYFQQDVISNTIRHIPLFLLNVDDSTTFILKVQDTNLLPISDALIHIQRFDVGSGNFSTVSIAKTDDNGQTVGFFKTETVDYRFIIRKNNVTLLTTSQGKVVPETAPFTLTFTVGADEGAPWVRFEDLPDLTKSLVHNQTSSITSFTYVDTSGNFTSSRLLVIVQNLSGSSQTICDVTSTQAAAILTCDTNSVSGTYTASGFITRGSSTFLVEQIIFSIQTFSDTVGLYGVFLAFFLILISSFAFKFNEIAGIVLVNITVMTVNIIGLVNFGALYIFGLLGVSVIIIVLLEK